MSGVAIDAAVELLPSAEGGRRSPVRSGYRPALWFGETAPSGEPHLHSSMLELVGRSELAPGESAEVRIRPFAFETWPEVEPGTPFDLFDADRRVGRGTLRQAPERSIAEAQLLRALNEALEEWVVERFPGRVAHRPRVRGRAEPDLVARFDDEEGIERSLIVEIVSRKPRRVDIDRLARMMDERGALLGVILASDPPSARILRELYQHGTIELSPDLHVPRIRWITSRDFGRGEIDLLPRKREPRKLQLLAA